MTKLLINPNITINEINFNFIFYLIFIRITTINPKNNKNITHNHLTESFYLVYVFNFMVLKILMKTPFYTDRQNGGSADFVLNHTEFLCWMNSTIS